LASTGDPQAAAKTVRAAAPSFKQYREKDGQFYFKLVDAQGSVLLQSLGFSSPKDAGLAIAQLQHNEVKEMADLGSQIILGEGVSLADVAKDLDALRAEMAEKAKAKGSNLT
jgi:tryptophanyl-tRNA synthetase